MRKNANKKLYLTYRTAFRGMKTKQPLQDTQAMYAWGPALIAANKLRRPVRCALSRREDLLVTGTRHPVMTRYKYAVFSDLFWEFRTVQKISFPSLSAKVKNFFIVLTQFLWFRIGCDIEGRLVAAYFENFLNGGRTIDYSLSVTLLSSNSSKHFVLIYYCDHMRFSV